MTEELHCYENGMAERLNGILKSEYFLDRHFKTKAEARKVVKEAPMRTFVNMQNRFGDFRINPSA